MKKHESIYLLFRFEENSQSQEPQQHNRYRVIYFFDEYGLISSDMLSSFHLNHIENNIFFRTKEDMLRFALSFIEEHRYQNCFLLSVNDYNIGVESCHQLSDYLKVFSEYGHKLENTEQSKSSIFGKLF
jgi:hypothetical protein